MTDSGTPTAATLGIDAPSVSAWLSANIPGCQPPFSFRLISGGRSNLTYEVTDGSGSRLVLRRPPVGHVLPTAHDMGREYRIIAALGPAGIPVAPALGLCSDEDVNGAPFYVMGFVDGHVVRNPEQAKAALTTDGRRRASADLVDVLVAIHAVDPDDVGLGQLGRREGYVARQLRRWEGQYRASRDEHGGPPMPDLEEAHRILSQRMPDQATTTIVHGDYRLDNTVVGGDGTVRAVLDWELSTLGDPLADLGATIAYWAEAGDPGTVLESSPTLAPGFFNRRQVAERYAASSGRDLSDLDYYVALAYWKLGCIIEGVYARYAAGVMGDPGADVSDFRRSLDWLASEARQRAEAVAR
jgi:aminoglycoside phosphotransferase (APT) family kinase protein